MAAGTPGGRRHLVEMKEIAGPASRWSWPRTTDGRAASGNGYHRAHGGPTGDEGCVSTSWNSDFLQEAVNGESAELVRALVPRWKMPKRAFKFCAYLPLLASHTCFEQSRPPSRAKLRQITTLWWSGRWHLS